MKRQTRLVVITGCHDNGGDGDGCPHLGSELTKGYGYDTDYYCKAVTPRRLIDSYVEWQSEKRKSGDFPVFCPLIVGPEVGDGQA